MFRFSLPLALIACGSPTKVEPAAVLDPSPALEASAAVQLDALIGLVEQPMSGFPTSPECPSITPLLDDAEVLHERIIGDCELPNGHLLSGSLERYDGPDGTWLIGSDFQVVDDDQLIFGLDGAIEITPTGSLWLVDAAAALCGTHDWSCTDGVLALDLSYTVFPAEGYPADYDATVSGTVVTERASMTLDGAWSVNIAQCPLEPLTGMLSIQQGEHHAITHDGALACDGCAGWQVQGRATDGLCGLTD